MLSFEFGLFFAEFENAFYYFVTLSFDCFVHAFEFFTFESFVVGFFGVALVCEVSKMVIPVLLSPPFGFPFKSPSDFLV